MKKETVKKFFEFLDRKENKTAHTTVFVFSPETIPKGFVVEGDLDLKYTSIQYLPEGLMVRGDLDLMYTSIQSLPKILTVRGSLNLQETPIQSLPKGLSVGRSLRLTRSSIQSLPEELAVGMSLYLGDTPLSRKYTQGEIQRMIESTGGYVRGKIYL